MGKNDKRNNPNTSINDSNLINEITSQEAENNSAIVNNEETSSTSQSTNTQSTTTTETSTSAQCEDITTALHDEMVKADETLRSINSIRTEICKLPLDLCERQYFDNKVLPLLTTINFISNTSVNLATSVSILTTSPIVPRKKGKLRNTIKLIYDMNSKCDDIYKELENRIDIMMNEE